MNVLLFLLMGLTAATKPIPSVPVTTLRFSEATPGTTLPAGWKNYRMSRHRPKAPVALVRKDGHTVLSIEADHDAGAIAHHLDLPANTILSWRWMVDHSVPNADMMHRSGNDFAARVYVFFKLPRSSLSWYQRMKLDLAKHTLGHPVPTAALCYVWDNSHAVGTMATSPYFSGMHVIVLQSGNQHAGTWQPERRNLATDFRAAFGYAAPRITGIALASDTDNTDAHAHAWFGDLSLTPAKISNQASD